MPSRAAGPHGVPHPRVSDTWTGQACLHPPLDCDLCPRSLRAPALQRGHPAGARPQSGVWCPGHLSLHIWGPSGESREQTQAREEISSDPSGKDEQSSEHGTEPPRANMRVPAGGPAGSGVRPRPHGGAGSGRGGSFGSLPCPVQPRDGRLFTPTAMCKHFPRGRPCAGQCPGSLPPQDSRLQGCYCHPHADEPAGAPAVAPSLCPRRRGPRRPEPLHASTCQVAGHSSPRSHAGEAGAPVPRDSSPGFGAAGQAGTSSAGLRSCELLGWQWGNILPFFPKRNLVPSCVRLAPWWPSPSAPFWAEHSQSNRNGTVEETHTKVCSLGFLRVR